MNDSGCQVGVLNRARHSERTGVLDALRRKWQVRRTIGNLLVLLLLAHNLPTFLAICLATGDAGAGDIDWRPLKCHQMTSRPFNP